VPQGLDERPLVVDVAVKRCLGQRHRTRHGALPQPLQDCPRVTEPVAVVGTHLRPLRHAAVEFGLDERCNIHPIDHDVLQFAADLDIDELDPAHPAAVERAAADLRAAEVDRVHVGVPEADALETSSGEVLLVEPGHGHHARGVDMWAKPQLAV
jgi:hypothetical protein